MGDEIEQEVDEILANLETGIIQTEDAETKLERLIQTLEVKKPIPAVASQEEEPSAPPEKTKEEDIRTILSKATITQKIKFAMFGNSVCRALLIFDPNKMIQGFVLKNPKLRIGEVEDFAKSRNISDVALRVIAGKKEWMKSYKLKMSIVTNPKTPQDISLKWIRYLNESDIRNLARSKNIPQLIATTSRKILEAMSKRK